MTCKIEFKKEKETKNTIRYTEKVPPGTPPYIGTLYIQKWVGSPGEIKLILEW